MQQTGVRGRATVIEEPEKLVRVIPVSATETSQSPTSTTASSRRDDTPCETNLLTLDSSTHAFEQERDDHVDKFRVSCGFIVGEKVAKDGTWRERYTRQQLEDTSNPGQPTFVGIARGYNIDTREQWQDHWTKRGDVIVVRKTISGEGGSWVEESVIDEKAGVLKRIKKGRNSGQTDQRWTEVEHRQMNETLPFKVTFEAGDDSGRTYTRTERLVDTTDLRETVETETTESHSRHEISYQLGNKRWGSKTVQDDERVYEESWEEKPNGMVYVSRETIPKNDHDPLVSGAQEVFRGSALVQSYQWTVSMKHDDPHGDTIPLLVVEKFSETEQSTSVFELPVSYAGSLDRDKLQSILKNTCTTHTAAGKIRKYLKEEGCNTSNWRCSSTQRGNGEIIYKLERINSDGTKIVSITEERQTSPTSTVRVITTKEFSDSAGAIPSRSYNSVEYSNNETGRRNGRHVEITQDHQKNIVWVCHPGVEDWTDETVSLSDTAGVKTGTKRGWRLETESGAETKIVWGETWERAGTNGCITHSERWWERQMANDSSCILDKWGEKQQRDQNNQVLIFGETWNESSSSRQDEKWWRDVSTGNETTHKTGHVYGKEWWDEQFGVCPDGEKWAWKRGRALSHDKEWYEEKWNEKSNFKSAYKSGESGPDSYWKERWEETYNVLTNSRERQFAEKEGRDAHGEWKETWTEVPAEQYKYARKEARRFVEGDTWAEEWEEKINPDMSGHKWAVKQGSDGAGRRWEDTWGDAWESSMQNDTRWGRVWDSERGTINDWSYSTSEVPPGVL